MSKVYHKNGYQVTDSDPIRIGFSEVYMFERVERAEDGCEFSRIVIEMSSSGGTVEIDTHTLPFSNQAAELVKFFSKYIEPNN